VDVDLQTAFAPSRLQPPSPSNNVTTPCTLQPLHFSHCTQPVCRVPAKNNIRTDPISRRPPTILQQCCTAAAPLTVCTPLFFGFTYLEIRHRPLDSPSPTLAAPAPSRPSTGHAGPALCSLHTTHGRNHYQAFESVDSTRSTLSVGDPQVEETWDRLRHQSRFPTQVWSRSTTAHSYNYGSR